MEQRSEFFVDERRQVLRGQEAHEALRQRSDRAFLDGIAGVAKVTKERWEEAQRYESRTWLDGSLRALEDRNWDHRARFHEYSMLSSRRFRRGIELGCGPFTNIRYLLEVADIEDLWLLDPLITQYRRHPACRYGSGRLGGVGWAGRALSRSALRHPVRFARELENSWRVGGVGGRPVTLIESPIEEFAPGVRFDCVVMINVLEHCFDAKRVLSSLADLLEPGGIVVFHDKLYDAAKLVETIDTHFDAGHPIRLSHLQLRAELLEAFSPLFTSELQGEVADSPAETGELYFVGTRK